MSYYTQFERPSQAQQDDSDEITLVLNLANAASIVANHFESMRSIDEQKFEALRDITTKALTGIKVAANKALLQINHRDAAEAASEFFEAIDPLDLASGHLTATDIIESINDTISVACRMISSDIERRV